MQLLLTGRSEPRFLNGTIPPGRSYRLMIPTEIWHLVFGYLSVMEIQNVRLTTHKWTIIAIPFLFSEMNILQDRFDVEKLLFVARQEELRPRIKLLKLSSPILDMELLRREVCTGQIGKYVWGVDVIRDIMSTKRWLGRVRHCRQNVWDPKVLVEVFEHLQKLDRLEVGQISPISSLSLDMEHCFLRPNKADDENDF